MNLKFPTGLLAAALCLMGALTGEEAGTGELLWVFEAASEASYNDYFTEPAIDPDGTIYVALIPSKRSTSGTFYALNPTGTLRWSETFTLTPYESFGEGGETVGFQTPSVGDDGTVYFSCSGSQYAYTPEGMRKWKRTFPTTDPRDRTAITSPIAISQTGRIYLPQGDSGLFELDPVDGKTLWNLKSTSQLRVGHARSVVISPDQSLLFTAWSDNLFRLDADGNVLFKHYGGNKSFPSGAIPSPPALSETGRIFTPQAASEMPYYLGVRDGQPTSFPNFLNNYPGVSVTPVIDHDQSLIFPDKAGHLIKLDQNLNEVWSLDGYADQPVVLSEDGTIFAVTNDHENPTIRNLNSDGQTVFEIAGEMPDNRSTKPSYSPLNVALPLASLTLSDTGSLYAASRNGNHSKSLMVRPLWV